MSGQRATPAPKTNPPAPSTTQQLKLGVDDPLDSGAVHYGNGLLGTMMLAFFAKPVHVAALVGTPCGGVFYSKTGWSQLGMQTLGERAEGAGRVRWCRCCKFDFFSRLHLPANQALTN